MVTGLLIPSGIGSKFVNMIKANELRIGNWVNDTVSGNPIRRIKTHDFTSDLSYLEPIELSPEILEKAGFNRKESPINFPNPYRFLYEKGCVIIRFFDDKKFNIKIKDHRDDRQLNLHQLQNLYWVLVGEELEINL